MGSVLFAVSVLRLFPRGVVICLDSDIRLSIQVRKYFAVPALIVLLVLLFNYFAHVNCFAHNLFNFIARDLFNFFLVSGKIVSLAFGTIALLTIMLLFASFLSKMIS